jgi:sRNA-binding regulator protein Hfq
MNPQQPIFNRKPQPVGAPAKPKEPARDGGDVFLQRASVDKTPLAFHFQDGELIPSAMVKIVAKFSLLLSVQGEDQLVFKHALKKVTVEVQP